MQAKSVAQSLSSAYVQFVNTEMGASLTMKHSGVPAQANEGGFSQGVAQKASCETMRSTALSCGAMIVSGNKILLLKRLHKPYEGCWSLPGGKLNYQEPSLLAIRREVMEEIGIDVVVDCFLCRVNENDAIFTIKWISDIYLVRSFSGTPLNREPEKHSDIGWFPIRDLPVSPSIYVMRAIEEWHQRCLS